MKWLCLLLLFLSGCDRFVESPYQRAINACKEAQTQCRRSQDMLEELLKENPGLVITNMQWWAEHEKKYGL